MAGNLVAHSYAANHTATNAAAIFDKQRPLDFDAKATIAVKIGGAFVSISFMYLPKTILQWPNHIHF